MKLLNLLNKFRNDSLTQEELSELKRMINSSSDNELEKIIAEEFNREINPDNSNCDWKETVRHNVKETIRKSTRNRLLKFASIAASLLIIVIAVSVYLKWDGDYSYKKPIVFETSATETAATILPDGSRIVLSNSSALTYLPKNFNKKERRITFNGQGYFDVTKNPDAPFSITSGGLLITVKGTTFNFFSENTSNEDVLHLFSGKVEMKSSTTGKSVTLSPGEKCTYNRITGALRVSKIGDNDNALSWYTKELRFHNCPLDSVIRQLELNNNCIIQGIYKREKKFSGTLPSNDLNLALKTLNHVYSISLSACIN